MRRVFARTTLAVALTAGFAAAGSNALAHAVQMPPTPEYVYLYYSSLGGTIVGGYEFGSCGTRSWGIKTDYVAAEVEPGC